MQTLVVIALLSTLLFVVQIALAFLPNIELVSLLIMLFVLSFGLQKTISAIYIFALLEGLVFGFGIWWITYLYVWTILAVIVWLFRKNQSLIIWAVIAGAFGLSFGALTAVPYIISGGIMGGVAYWVSGIPFDIAHCVGNIIVTLLLLKPLQKLLCYIQHKPITK